MEPGKLTVVAISDLHGYLPKRKSLPEGDVLCIAGDILPLEYQRSDVKSLAWFLQDFTPWTDTLEYEAVILVPGNHDFLFNDLELGRGKSGGDILKAFYLDHRGKHKVKLLCDNSVEINGFRFYGTPWIPDLRNWAFYLEYDELEERFSNIPKKCDVLISHCPPKIAQAGQVLQQGWNFGRDFGCTQLADAIKGRDIKWVICGHVHSGSHTPYGMYAQDTMIVNVSLKDEDYKVKYEPFVFELKK